MIDERSATNLDGVFSKRTDIALGFGSFVSSVDRLAEQWTWSLKPTEFASPRWTAALSRQQIAIGEAVDTFLDPVAFWRAKIPPSFDLMRQIEILRKAHWLAHPTLPLAELVGNQTDPEVISLQVSTFVENYREDIYRTLQKRFENYDHDAETKAFALELIEAHRHGLYRLIVPAVFPEIERCARGTLRLGAGTNSHIVIKTLYERLGNLPISQLGSWHGMSALMMLDNYFYKSLRSDCEANNFKEMIHRHGSQHGLLRYNESRDCLNAIFLFDIVLLFCDAIQKSISTV